MVVVTATVNASHATIASKNCQLDLNTSKSPARLAATPINPINVMGNPNRR